MTTILEINDLSIHFRSKEGTVRAVDGLSFAVKNDEILGVVGESGCGKSVTAQAILNVLSTNGTIAGGNILYDRDGAVIDITTLNPDGRQIRAIRGKEIAMIFQEPMTSFSPLHTIGDQISEAIALHRSADDQPTVPAWNILARRRARKRLIHEQTIDILKQVGMPNPEEIIHAFPHNLSGGMRQRAMIAMALSCRPRILIADEPTTALDVTIQAQVLDLMLAMRSAFAMSIIFITHDLGVIAEIADRVVIMYLGKVMEIAPVDDLFYNPLHPYTKALINSVPRTTGPIEKLTPIEGTVPSPLEMPTGCRFHTRCPAAMPGLCDVREPPVQELAPGHQVACFLYPETEPV